MEEKKDWKERLRDFPFIRMYLLKEFKANNPKEQGMADILTLVKDKEFHDLIDFIEQELDKAREEGVKDGMRGMIDILCEKGCGSMFAVIEEKDVNKKIEELSKLTTK